jgi:hypothetical protein
MRAALLMVLLLMIAGTSLAQSVFAEASETKVADQDKLRQRCGVHHASGIHHELNGCTEFVERQLVCRCVLDASQWRISGRAHVQPRMYLADPHYEAHERLHLIDLSTRVHEHLRGLERARFDVLERCRAAAASAESEFPRRFDGFIRLSNLRLH